jgi:methionyl-tRNA formyltransferase
MRVFISGQKYFAGQVYDTCASGGLEIVGVCAPEADRHLAERARKDNIPIMSPPDLKHSGIPECDLALNAHGFAIIGNKALNVPRIGWLGYHPSLLPRHRGRAAVGWAIRFRDVITGGTLYWINNELDGGEIAYQSWCFIDPALFALDPKEASAILWREKLQPIGIGLFEAALGDIKSGVVRRLPQDIKYVTYEPPIK